MTDNLRSLARARNASSIPLLSPTSTNTATVTSRKENDMDLSTIVRVSAGVLAVVVAAVVVVRRKRAA